MCLSITVSSIYLFINLSCSLDFDNFVLAQPESTDHVCQNDQFVVSGGPPIPAVCGVNTGLHSKCCIFLTCVDYLKIILSNYSYWAKLQFCYFLFSVCWYGSCIQRTNHVNQCYERCIFFTKLFNQSNSNRLLQFK